MPTEVYQTRDVFTPTKPARIAFALCANVTWNNCLRQFSV